MFYHEHSVSLVMELPLPDPNQVVDDSWNLAFPQVLSWSSAATGILLVVMLIKSFLSR